MVSYPVTGALTAQCDPDEKQMVERAVLKLLRHAMGGPTGPKLPFLACSIAATRLPLCRHSLQVCDPVVIELQRCWTIPSLSFGDSEATSSG